MVSRPRYISPALSSITRVAFTAFILLFVVDVYANDIPYRHYSIQDGLPHENVSAIEQTPDGRLWVGTSAGLAFHTGLKFNAVRFLGATGTVNVTEIEPTANNEVWVSTNHQGIWKARFEHAKMPYEALAGVHARRLIERNDSLYVFASTELWVVDLLKDKVSQVGYAYPDGLERSVGQSSNRLNGVVSADIAPDGARWVLDRHLGPGRMMENGEVQFVKIPAGIKKEGWYSIRFDEYGTGWITHEKKGLYRFNAASGTLDLVISAQGVRHICVTPMMIAVTSFDLGTLYWDLRMNKQAHSLNEQSGFPTNRVNCIFRDIEKNVWVGTQIGLVQMNNPGVRHLDSVSNTPLVNMLDILRDADHAIWAVSQTEGVFQLHPGKHMEPDMMAKWTDFFVGQDEKIHLLSTKGWYSHNLESGWQHTQVFAGGLHGVVDEAGIGFFKHEDGLFRHEQANIYYPLVSWNADDYEFYHHALAVDGALHLWYNGKLLKVDKGVDSQAGENLQVIRDEPAFRRKVINDMVVDDMGRTWVAVLNEGLLCVEPDTTMQLLPGHQINTLSLSGDSLLIASANEGLFVFNLPEKANPQKGVHLDKDASVRYHLTQADGLLSSIVTGAAFSVSHLWINHPGGVTQIPISLLEREPPVPQVLLTSINYNGIEKPASKPFLLSSADRNIGFSFAAPTFAQPHRVHYRYRLKGYSEKWQGTDEAGVQFTDLPAGDYTFEVQAASSSLNYGISALYDFNIPEPYYQRPYFWVMILMLTVVLMYWLHRYRLHSLLQVERTRTRIAMDLHDDIGSSLTSLSFLSNLAWQRTDRQKPKEEIAPLLQEISSMSSELVDNMLDIVWSVDPTHDSVGSIIERLKAFYQRMGDAAEITMNWHVQDGVGEIALPPSSRRSLYLIMKEAINNAVKHSGSPVIDVRFDRDFSMLQIDVHDYGQGFDVEQMFSGYGLNTMKERAQQEGGTLEIFSKPGKETIVQIKWPVKNNV